MTQDPVTLDRRYSVIPEQRTPIEWFVRGLKWKFMGLVPTDLHLFGVDGSGGATCYLLGTDKLGQDMFSRILHGGRISLLLGLTGELLTFVLGVFLGGISGYYGGKIDIVIQRVVEILQSVPTIPIWLAMAAAIPKEWTSLQGYFAMTVILAIIGWTGLCRVVRGKLLALREEDYSRAALLAGASERRVIFVHLIPNFLSHIIASMTLAIPGIILAETSLSFLGLGLRPPVTSWGVLLKDAQNVQAVAFHPWLLAPVIFVILTVLAFNFLGDGLRDAADPYG
jgi:peptide/nickel transport system permease protein